jgi:hypothetical protein
VHITNIQEYRYDLTNIRRIAYSWVRCSQSKKDGLERNILAVLQREMVVVVNSIFVEINARAVKL